MKVYPPRDIRPFVMYCVNGKPRSSLIIESTDSMTTDSMIESTVIRRILHSSTISVGLAQALLNNYIRGISIFLNDLECSLSNVCYIL